MLLGTFDNSLIGRLAVSLNKHAVSGIDNERIDVPARNSVSCKASRPVDWAFGSAICRANSLRFQNLLFPIHRARTDLRAVRVNRPHHFLFLAARKTRAGLRLDWVSGVVRFYLQYSVSLRYRIDLLPQTPEPSITHSRPLI